MSRLSIRWRITLWNTAGFAVVLLGFGFLVYGLLRETHYQQVDTGLKARFNELVQTSRLGGPAGPRLETWVQKHPKIPIIVFDGQGQTLIRSERLASFDNVKPATNSSSDVFCDGLAIAGLGHMRRLTGRIVDDSNTYTVVLLWDLGHVDEEMGEVVAALAFTTPIALGVAAAIAYWLARSSLAPVEELRRLTNEITADRLDRRLPVAVPSDEIGLLAQTVNSMIERLERSFTEIRRFTADASHELRTPIAVIRSESEMGLDASATLENAHSRFASILEECAQLTSMTDQLLTLSREDAGIAKPRRDPVELLPLVRDVVNTMLPVAGEKDHTLTAGGEDNILVSGDDQRLRQVLYNLVANAIKYTPPGGQITVTVGSRDGEAVITVRDNGIGISADHLPHVFDRFYRVDKGRSQREGGTGLGLSIVRSIITAHGGRVEAESTAGEGSTFRVFLPRVSSPESAKN